MINRTTAIMMLDTETTNDIETPIVYDVGYQIFTLADGVLEEKSFVNATVFLDDFLMESAYFHDKIPSYWRDIRANKRQLKSWYNIKKALSFDCKRYGVNIICAHNAMFDNKSLNTTQRYLTSSRFRWFLPYGMTWWDTLKMAREILNENPQYLDFCLENGYVTSNNKPRMTAEVIYRFLTNDSNFEEAHTGLEDVKIERKIFEYLLQQKPDIDGRLWK